MIFSLQAVIRPHTSLANGPANESDAIVHKRSGYQEGEPNIGGKEHKIKGDDGAQEMDL